MSVPSFNEARRLYRTDPFFHELVSRVERIADERGQSYVETAFALALHRHNLLTHAQGIHSDDSLPENGAKSLEEPVAQDRRTGGTAGPPSTEDRHRWLMESIREGFPEYDPDEWPILSTLEDVRRRLDESTDWNRAEATAQLMIDRCGEITTAGRKAIAKWLRNQAHLVESSGENFDDTFRARYLRR